MNNEKGSIELLFLFLLVIFVLGIIFLGITQEDITPEFYEGSVIQCEKNEGLRYITSDLHTFHVVCNDDKVYYNFDIKDALLLIHRKEKNGNL